LTERVFFQEGLAETVIANSTSPQAPRRYLVNAQAGQVMSIEILEGNASVDIRYQDGSLIDDARGLTFWQATLPESGDYQIDVLSDSPTEFRLRVGVTGTPF
jgi:hypothetical protein